MIAKVKGNKIEIKDPVTLVQGTVGQTLGVELPADWEGLSVTAVFSAGAVQRDVPVLGGEITIPWEVLADPHAPLALCFHAAAANGQRVITTANCDPIRIAPSTPPSGQEPETPSPSRADQIQALAQQALAAAQSVSTQAAQGAFNGRDGVDGTNGTDGISPAVSVSEIQGGHRIQITDAAGSRSFDVLDGAPGEVTEAELETALASKADVNGSYDSMTVGNAKQLVATVGVTDRTPYTFRTAGGSADIGDRAVDKLVGGTIAWNQLIQNGNFADDAHWFGNGAAFTVSGGAASVTPTQKWGKMQEDANSGRNVIAGHRYLAIAEVIGDTHTYIEFGAVIAKYLSHESSTWQQIAAIGTASAAGYARFGIGTNATDNFKTISVRNAQIHDLTQMFGAQIADHVYALEQSTPGAGVAWFKKLFPKPTYAYNPGELISVKAAARRTVGFNAYNHTTGKAKLVGGMPYQITGAYTALTLDGEAITPDTGGYFTPAGSGELTVTGGDSATTCVHLVWDGERDGEYAPYEEHSYPLDDTLTLRGVPKLDSGNNLYFDGDAYASDGTVTRKFAVTTITAADIPADGSGYIGTTTYKGKPCVWIRNLKYVTGSDPFSVLKDHGFSGKTAKYEVVINDTGYFSSQFRTLFLDCSSREELLSFIGDGTPLVYELAAPVFDEAAPYQNPQIVDDFGTEEYIVPEQTGVTVPVGHETVYQSNLRAKLEMAPESPDGDGDYIVRQTNGENRYVPLTIPAELPPAPTADGTYRLQITVTNGTAALSWVNA